MKSLIYETPIEPEEDIVARIAAAAGDASYMPGVFENIHNSLR